MENEIYVIPNDVEILQLIMTTPEILECYYVQQRIKNIIKQLNDDTTRNYNITINDIPKC